MLGPSHTKFMNMREWIATENSIGPEVLVFLLGGITYGLMEILYRGHTHWSMVLTGGACIVTLYILVGWLNEMPLVASALVGALVVTTYEFTVGCIVNLRFGMGIWDYSGQFCNLLGQICLAFSAVWYVLCFVFLGIIRYFAQF